MSPKSPTVAPLHTAWQVKIREVFSRRMLQTWYGSPDELPAMPVFRVLKAASKLYERVLKKEQASLLRRQVRLPAYVISIGNIAVGGTGKTPLAIWICRWLLANGPKPAILSRGYGRTGHGIARVPSCGDSAMLAGLFGDEPVLMARQASAVPVWVGRERAVSGKAAIESSGVDTLILDDGFQHLGLARDLDIVLIDCRNPMGNGFLLPAGPLREPLCNMERADAFILTHAESSMDVEKLELKIRRFFLEKSVFTCRHSIAAFRRGADGVLLPFRELQKRKAVLFAGIAKPEGFFHSIRELGITARAAFPFPDHYRYSVRDLRELLDSASRLGAEFIITTSKDAIRLPADFNSVIVSAEMDLDFGSDRDPFQDFLKRRLGL